MSTLYSDPQQSDGSRNRSAWELARLLCHWLVASAVIALIASLFALAPIIPGEMVPILISAFAILGIGLAGCCLWVMAAGLPAVRRAFYGPLPLWPRQRGQKASVPWFDVNGAMLWQRDDLGRWVRKVDVTSSTEGTSGQTTNNGYQ